MSLVRSLSRHLESGNLEELTLTTNGSQLPKYSQELFDYGVRRVNVSCDTLDPEQFAKITRWGSLQQVFNGVEAAKKAGLKVKINAVALKGANETEFDNMIKWCGDNGFDLTLIETMPMGEISGDRKTHRPIINGHMFVPMDDENTMVYNWIGKHGTGSLTEDQREYMERIRGRAPGEVDKNHRKRRNKDVDWLIDREVQKTKSYSGIEGINTQDHAVQESMGPIIDRKWVMIIITEI